MYIAQFSVCLFGCDHLGESRRKATPERALKVNAADLTPLEEATIISVQVEESVG